MLSGGVRKGAAKCVCLALLRRARLRKTPQFCRHLASKPPAIPQTRRKDKSVSEQASTSAEGMREMLEFARDVKFEPSSFGASLTSLIEALENCVIASSQLRNSQLEALRSSCEEWTSACFHAERRATEFHTILRAHTLLKQPLSPQLRTNTRLWLSRNSLTLQSVEIFPFFGHLSALAKGGDADDIRSQLGSSPKLLSKCRALIAAAEQSYALSHGIAWMGILIRQVQRHFDKATPSDLLQLLCDYVQLHRSLSHVDMEIVQDLVTKLRENCELLTLEDGSSVIAAMDAVGLTPEPEFWMVFAQRPCRYRASKKPQKFLAAMGQRQNPACRVLPIPVLPIFGSVATEDSSHHTADIPSHQLQLCLRKLELALMLDGALALPTTSVAFAKKHLTKNSDLWRTLLERAPELALFRGDRPLLHAFIKLFMWAPISLTAEVETLMLSFRLYLRDEVVQLLLHSEIVAGSGQSAIVCNMIRKQLYLVNDVSPFTLDGKWWHTETSATRPIGHIFHDLALLAKQSQGKGSRITPPTAEWWAEFRQRMTTDTCQPTAENWMDIVKTVNQLLRFLPKNHMYRLPPVWYTKFLDLAARQLSESCSSKFCDANDLLQMLAAQHICVGDEHQAVLMGIIERFCTNEVPAELFVQMLDNALTLELPIPARVWQHASDGGQIFARTRPNQRLITNAASSWALALPGAPPASVLHCLVQAGSESEAIRVPGFWQKLHQLLGDDFMPPGITELLHCSPHPRAAVKRNNSGSNAKLLARLTAEYGVTNVQSNVALCGAAGRSVDHLVAMPDGNQKVFQCDKAGFHSWFMPDDGQAGLTLAAKIFIHLIERAGFQFEMVKID